MSQNLLFGSRVPVPPNEIRIECVGVRAIDGRRLDVAVDLTPCSEPVRVELVVVGPGDDELASTTLLHNRAWQLDKIVHLRRDAEPGEHTLHVGVFFEGKLVTRAARRFLFRQTGSG